MICARHKTPYKVSCPKCDESERLKEENLQATLATMQKPGRFGKATRPMPLQWHKNPLYEGRDYTHKFRSKVLHALTLIDKFPYKGLVNASKSMELDLLQRNGRLDDVFQVSRNEIEWTSLVQALGGNHGNEVYSSDGTLLGKIMSYGCTTHSRVTVTNGQATKDDLGSLAAIIDDSKVIYLHSKEVKTSTIVHELFHYFCDRDFYKAFGDAALGPEWKTMNEGVTEYFARMACKGQTHGAYQSEYDTVTLLLQKTKFSEDQLADAYFRGNIEPFKKVMKEGEMKESEVGAAQGMDKVFAAFEGGGRRGKKK